MVYLCGRPLPQPRPLHARPRDRDSEDGLGRRRLAAHRRRRGLPTVDTDAPRAAAAAASRHRRRPARTSTAPQLPIDFQWLRSPWPDELFSLTARPGYLAALRPRNDRQPVPAGARRAPAAVALLQRGDERRIRAAALPADGGPGLLLQQLQVPLPHVSTTSDRQARSGHVGAARPRRRRTRSRRPLRFRRTLPSNCGSRSTTSVCISATASAAPNGPGSRNSSTPASSPTKRLRRGCRTSRARSSAWRARTCPVPPVPPISTGSSTSSGRTASIRSDVLNE